MPPKPKFTKEDVAQAAFEIVKGEGVATLTARELGKRLGTSSSPIFTLFPGMEAVKLAARELALEEFKQYISDFREYTPAFKRIGLMMVSYGVREPELFKLLFMQQHSQVRGFQGTMDDLGEIGDVCLELLQRDYDLTSDQARLIFEQMWTQAFGLGAMCATGVCCLAEEEIGRRQGMLFVSLISFLKSGDMAFVFSDAEKRTDGTFHGMALVELSQSK